MGPAGPAGGQCDGGHQVTTAASVFVFQRAAGSSHMQVLQEGTHQRHMHVWFCMSWYPLETREKSKWREQRQSLHPAHRKGHPPHSHRHALGQGAAAWICTWLGGKKCDTKGEKANLEVRWWWWEHWAGEWGSLAEGQGAPGQKGMLEMKDSLLISSPRKDHFYLKCNECTQNLCPDAHIRDIKKKKKPNTYFLFSPSYFVNEWWSQQSQPMITISNPFVLFPFQTEKEIISFWFR